MTTTPNIIGTKLVYSRHEIRARIASAAVNITAWASYNGCTGLTLVPIMWGSMTFVSDLARALHIRCPQLRLRFAPVRARSYDKTDRGALSVDPLPDLYGPVLIVDDIFDSGHTLRTVTELVKAMPTVTQVRSVVLLEKLRENDPIRTIPTWALFNCPDKFVVGYGLDLDGLYRELPDVVELLTLLTTETPVKALL